MARRRSTSTPTPAEAPAPEQAAPAEREEPTVLTGRLCADPQLRHTHTSGKPVTSIRLAVPDGEETSFHTVVVWGRTAEVVCDYMRKGRLVECTGRWRERSYQAEDGPRQVRELHAFSVQFLRRPVAAQAAVEDERAVA